MAIKLNIKATNITLTPAISEYLNKKIDTLKKFFDPVAEEILASVEIGKSTERHKTGEVYRAEINLLIPGKQLRAVSEKDTLYAAIDEMKDEIIRELSAHKNKQQTLLRRGGQKIKNLLRGLRW